MKKQTKEQTIEQVKAALEPIKHAHQGDACWSEYQRLSRKLARLQGHKAWDRNLKPGPGDVQELNDKQGLGINHAKVSDYCGTRVVTFGSGVTGKFCYILSGRMQFNSDFAFKDHQEAATAAFQRILSEEGAR
jgi:hypothetical protein